jgi:hypothetical protein
MSVEAKHLNPSVLTDEELDRIAFALVGRISKHFVEGSEKPLTREKAAEYMGVSHDTIDRLRRTKVIKPHFLPGLSTPFYFASELYKKIKES